MVDEAGPAVDLEAAEADQAFLAHGAGDHLLSWSTATGQPTAKKYQQSSQRIIS